MALLAALKICSAHICVFSMGGMIAHLIAIHYRDCVLSLTSVSSHTGSSEVVGPTRLAKLSIFKPERDDARSMVEFNFRRGALMSGKVTPDARFLAILERTQRRSVYNQGAVRQLAAAVRAPSRVPSLRKLSVPTLVVHGAC